ncbi:metal-dependent phosphohydrolase HD sub domain p rotein [Mycolicibacterium canariasense]|uniref:Metal-dependent phosphohydrolase HD sub domain p rotein n=1 Tax=Mycolicibacterium canariasense TaxID=228230 RepID=A0A100WG40_MYCCR|nr:HD domain-containing protein [Mycolicibacterium canariasense]ORV13855.1 phosphohydrolase [Mycolicibacterium canariasense]GAS97889.1 metal-dependent phosphohydrolase HD sub domain p rotein [Mycolicibacterium canariasense]
MSIPDDTAAEHFGLPDSAVATAARKLVHDVSPDCIYNHTVRSYLFARELLVVNGPPDDHDDELLFLACILHDLGATEHANTDQRFEVDGADAAALFLRAQDLDATRIETAWTAIALHTSVGLAHRFGPIPAAAHIGISTDIVGAMRHALPDGYAERVHATWPRYDLGYALAEIIARQAERNSAKAPPLSFPAHVLGLLSPGNASATWIDLIDGAGWNDRPTAAWQRTS